MTTDTPISSEVANHVLWCWSKHWGEPIEGYQPGSFTELLIKTIEKADPNNRRSLRLGYPAYVAAIEILRADGGVDVLRAAAGRVLA